MRLFTSQRTVREMKPRTDPLDLPRVEARRLESGGAAELYLTATPPAPPRDDVLTQARALYAAVRDQLVASRARILSERLFATSDAISDVETARRELYGALDDGVPPTRVVVSPSSTGRFAGAQIHAICEPDRPTTLGCHGGAGATSARLLDSGGGRWLFINGIGNPADIDEAEQARRMFFCTGCFLRQAGTTMKSVARTWLWLKDICGWYDQFNDARTTFFRREGLIDDETRITHLPASTGIGLYGASGAACTLDLIALPGREDEIDLIEAGGDQRSAYEYGSAFSRAAVVPMPAGRTVFVSGTASIDNRGVTEGVGMVESQISGTIAHVRSLLADLGCRDEHVLTALAYCKDANVERAFRRQWTDLSWPRLTMIGEVCRPELLFETEVTASPALGSGLT